jgi:Sulfotransferase family/Aspartyl/Asparaginyl beta-hydroxylase
MRLAQPFQKLPRRFAAGPLAEDVAQFGQDDFISYRAGSLGAAALPLVSPGGAPTHNFALAGLALPTPALARCLHIQEALIALGVRIVRSRLVRLTAHTSASSEGEWNYHWFRHVPICIPIQTDEAVTLQCGDEIAHLAAGEAWIVDTSRRHALHNRSARDCLHLIVEIRAEATETVRAAVPPGNSLRLESYRFEVLTPQEIAALSQEILTELGDKPLARELHLTLAQLADRWEATFARFGHDSKGELAYQDLLLDFREQIMPRLPPGGTSAQAAIVIDTMLTMAPPSPRKLHRPAAIGRPRDAALAPPPEFDRPLFIVSAPRAGSTLLFDLVARFGEVFTLGGESHEIIRGIPELHPAARAYTSDRLTHAEARPEIAAALREGFARRLVDRAGRSYLGLPAGERPRRVRLIEKTPANALRIPFLRAVFPGALFVHLYRDPRQNISSLVEGWRSRRFLAYRGMPGWPYRDWSFLLPPGWSSLVGCSLVEIAAHQWQVANATIEADLRDAPSGASCKIDYDDLIRTPRESLRNIAELAGLTWDAEVEAAVSAALPLSRVTLSAPAPHKWWQYQEELTALLPRLCG